MSLTDARVRTLKVHATADRLLADGGGLYIRVRREGGKLGLYVVSAPGSDLLAAALEAAKVPLRPMDITPFREVTTFARRPNHVETIPQQDSAAGI